MDIMQGWFEFIADEIFRNGEVSFNRQGLLRHIPREMLAAECGRRGWEILDVSGNGVHGLMIRPLGDHGRAAPVHPDG